MVQWTSIHNLVFTDGGGDLRSRWRNATRCSSTFSRRCEKNLNRRSFLGSGAVAAAAALVPGRAQAAVSGAAKRRERVLSFFHTHTGERIKIAYCCDGNYQPEALAQINHLLRDFRVNEEKPIDPKLSICSTSSVACSKPISRFT